MQLGLNSRWGELLRIPHRALRLGEPGWRSGRERVFPGILFPSFVKIGFYVIYQVFVLCSGFTV